MAVLNGVIPVFLIVGLGLLARRLGWMDEGFVRNLNRIIFWFAIPALMVRLIGNTKLDESFSVHLVFTVCAATVLAALPVVVFALVRRMPTERSGVMVQATVRGNIAFVAFPVIFAAAGGEALAVAAVTAAVLIPFQNLIAVVALAAGGGRSPFQVLRVSLLNPVVLGAMGGIAWSLLHVEAWPWLDTFLELIGNIAMPGALLAVGGQLDIKALQKDFRPAVVTTVLKVVAVPALGFALMTVVGVDGVARLVGVLLLAAPTAVASTAVAQEMGGDVDLAGACVMASSLASLPAFVLWGLAV